MLVMVMFKTCSKHCNFTIRLSCPTGWACATVGGDVNVSFKCIVCCTVFVALKSYQVSFSRRLDLGHSGANRKLELKIRLQSMDDTIEISRASPAG